MKKVSREPTKSENSSDYDEHAHNSSLRNLVTFLNFGRSFTRHASVPKREADPRIKGNYYDKWNQVHN